MREKLFEGLRVGLAASALLTASNKEASAYPLNTGPGVNAKPVERVKNSAFDEGRFVNAQRLLRPFKVNLDYVVENQDRDFRDVMRHKGLMTGDRLNDNAVVFVFKQRGEVSVWVGQGLRPIFDRPMVENEEIPAEFHLFAKKYENGQIGLSLDNFHQAAEDVANHIIANRELLPVWESGKSNTPVQEKPVVEEAGVQEKVLVLGGGIANKHFEKMKLMGFSTYTLITPPIPAESVNFEKKRAWADKIRTTLVSEQIIVRGEGGYRPPKDTIVFLAGEAGTRLVVLHSINGLERTFKREAPNINLTFGEYLEKVYQGNIPRRQALTQTSIEYALEKTWEEAYKYLVIHKNAAAQSTSVAPTATIAREAEKASTATALAPEVVEKQNISTATIPLPPRWAGWVVAAAGLAGLMFPSLKKWISRYSNVEDVYGGEAQDIHDNRSVATLFTSDVEDERQFSDVRLEKMRLRTRIRNKVARVFIPQFRIDKTDEELRRAGFPPKNLRQLRRKLQRSFDSRLDRAPGNVPSYAWQEWESLMVDGFVNLERAKVALDEERFRDAEEVLAKADEARERLNAMSQEYESEKSFEELRKLDWEQKTYKYSHPIQPAATTADTDAERLELLKIELAQEVETMEYSRGGDGIPLGRLYDKVLSEAAVTIINSKYPDDIVAAHARLYRAKELQESRAQTEVAFNDISAQVVLLARELKQTRKLKPSSVDGIVAAHIDALLRLKKLFSLQRKILADFRKEEYILEIDELSASVESVLGNVGQTSVSFEAQLVTIRQIKKLIARARRLDSRLAKVNLSPDDGSKSSVDIDERVTALA